MPQHLRRESLSRGDPTHPSEVEFDELTVIDSDGLLGLREIPSSIVVVGVVGIEYASMLAPLGTKVTVVERRPTMLEFGDDEIVEGLRHHLRDQGLVFRFGEEAKIMPELLPFGIYTIPEISFVGRTEEELTEAGIPYEIGMSRYRELARGQILGDSHGMLKLLVSAEDRRLVGVHALGAGATEVIHIGQTVMAFGGTIDYLVEAVFNYPTLAEGYKVAALDAANKIAALARMSG